MNLLNEREKTHGDFREVARVAQRLKDEIWSSSIPDVHQEALDMICVKMARIVCGDHNEVDHFQDIIGYAQLVLNHIKKSVPSGSSDQQGTPDESECDFCGGDTYHRPWCILRRNEG